MHFDSAGPVFLGSLGSVLGSLGGVLGVLRASWARGGHPNAPYIDLKSVSKILNTLLESKIIPTAIRVRGLLESKIPVPELYIIQPRLSEYDELIAVAG